jgi:YcaO-like protein with predicted kinase domain
MRRDGFRKDAPAADTIERVHAILDSLGFPRNRATVTWWSAGPDCHSCNLRFSNYPSIFSNGKGATRELAYAGALAEFVERLQCRVDDLFTRAGNIHRLPLFTPRIRRRLADISQDSPRLVSDDLGALTGADVDPFQCMSCCDVVGGRVLDLPVDAFTMMTGSSGMCAGNTPEEAVAQGLCEVFERHALRVVAEGRVAGLPSLPLDSLPLGSAVVRAQLEWLRAAGTEVLVKDASLGGEFPVVALVLLDRRAGTCLASFGSDPDFDIALSRCITEAFQGTDRMARPLPPDDQALRSPDVYNRVELLIDRLIDDVGTPAAEKAFRAVEDNGEALAFALERAARHGRGVYVRDCSVFGFPAFYVYVEELSALSRLTPVRFAGLWAEWERVRATVFALGDATRDAVERCAGTLFGEITRSNPLVERGFAGSVLNAPVVASLEVRALLLLMLLEAGRLADARAILARPPLVPPALERAATLRALASLLPGYARSRGGRIQVEDLRAAFTRAFGDVDQSVAAGTGAVDEPLSVPRCHSVYGCPACPCRPFCRLDEWYRLARRLRDCAVPPDQAAWLELPPAPATRAWGTPAAPSRATPQAFRPSASIRR